MNVIAAPKTGKSWMVYNLALSLSCGLEWMGYKSGKDLKVLICDNELHKEELAWRVDQVARSLNVKPGKKIEFNVLRGSDVDVNELDKKLDEAGASRFDIVVIDSFYRILPKGMSENDNASMTQVFNKLNTIARKNEVSIINIHHSSKGSQGDKGVTDVGSGAGAISRAADTHLAIREHCEEGMVVIDAVTRSAPDPPSVSAVFEFPTWKLSDIEPLLKTFGNARDSNNKRTREKAKNLTDSAVSYFLEAGSEGSTLTGCWEGIKLEAGSTIGGFKNRLNKYIDSENSVLKKTKKVGQTWIVVHRDCLN